MRDLPNSTTILTTGSDILLAREMSCQDGKINVKGDESFAADSVEQFRRLGERFFWSCD
jgi:hypothetical protein